MSSKKKSKNSIAWEDWHIAELQNCRDLPAYDKNVSESDVPNCIRIQKFQNNNYKD